MSIDSRSAETKSPDAGPQPRPLLETLLIVLLFYLLCGSNPPHDNEAHYLAKAKHFWDPAWCAKDFFLNTADAHWLFFASYGWVGRLVSLNAMAWIGRFIVWTLQAFAWQRLSSAVAPTRLVSLLTAAWMVTLNQKFHMAGEWFIGGVEAKGFAFAFMLLALATLARGDWKRVWLWLGAATAFHVLVGSWAAICVALAWLATSSKEKPRFVSLFPSIACGFALSLPGLIPSLALSTDAPSADQAATLQVFHRLSHHLLITSLSPSYWFRFGGMVLAWVLLLFITRKQRRDAPIQKVVVGSLALVLVGVGITFGYAHDPSRAAELLKFYWYRPADILVPLGIAMALAPLIPRAVFARSAAGTTLFLTLLIPPVAHLGQVQYDFALGKDFPSRGDCRMPFPEDWVEVCRWVAKADEIPSDALFLTPLRAQTFRWHASRGEVVSRKDMPQDSQSIVDWWDRLSEIHSDRQVLPEEEWHQSLTEIEPDRLRSLATKYGARYIITESAPRLPFQLLGPPNKAYAIYDLSAEK